MATTFQSSPTFLLSLLLLTILLQPTTIFAQASPPGPTGPTNITQILEKAGQFTTLIRLMKTTQMGSQINTQLNNSNQGITVFAPTDNAFSSLKPGTLNSLSDQQKVSLLQFHVIPNYLSPNELQTASNPLRTQAGDTASHKFPLNITTTGNNQVNVSTGVVETTVSNSIYTDGSLAVYQVDKVLLPMALFGPSSPAPAPAPEPLKKKKSGTDDDAPAKDGGSATADSNAGVVIGSQLHGFCIGVIVFMTMLKN